MSDDGIHVLLTTGFPDWPLLRQTPGGKGIWGDCIFHVNEHVETCDWWVVYDALPEARSALCPPENTVFVTGEPPSLRTYGSDFLAQFARVVTCHSAIRHPGAIRVPQGLPWHVGVVRDARGRPEASRGYDQLAALQDVAWRKTKPISVLCSDKRMSEGHLARLRLLDALHAHFGDRLDVFGRGFREVPDKGDAIEPYRYHVCFENTALPDYFTESLTDTYLACALPIYWGCTNLAEYMPEDAFVAIDVEDPTRAIETIEAVLDEDPYDRREPALREARRRVLDRFNLFAMLAELCRGRGHGTPVEIALVPEPPPRRPLAERIRGRLRSLLHRPPDGEAR